MGNSFCRFGVRLLRRRPGLTSPRRSFSPVKLPALSSWTDLLIAALLLSLSFIDCTADQSLKVTITPAGSGRQLARFSVPLPNGFLKQGLGLTARKGAEKIFTVIRPLTWHPSTSGKPRFVRAAMVTFPFESKNADPVTYSLTAEEAPMIKAPPLPATIECEGSTVRISYADGPPILVKLIAPALDNTKPRIEVIEENRLYRWVRYHFADSKWPRIIEVRTDALGQVSLVAHLQNPEKGYGRAPDFGWDLDAAREPPEKQADSEEKIGIRLLVAEGEPAVFDWSSSSVPYRIYHPMQLLYRRGTITHEQTATQLKYHYLRCRADESVPMQEASWRRADVVIAPNVKSRTKPGLHSPHLYGFGSRGWDALYATGTPQSKASNGANGVNGLTYYTTTGVIDSMAVGDDAGNVTGFSHGSKQGGSFGMNRLNHCGEMFLEGLRTSNSDLIQRALLWCDNFYDLSIWWGPGQTGGTRYNNLAAMGQAPPPSDPPFMWRSNSAVSFCTKGFDSFFIAYELTGDPRYLESLNAQVDYASKYMTAGENYTRNVGCVRDFVNLYKWTGEKKYLDQALRLFRETRAVLSTGDLFTESGRAIEADPPFIENDAQGYQHPFSKPYILGYALEGLPELLKLCPKEPKLREVVQAVADFMVSSQDPIGGWRYPHPRSSYVIMSQAMEHAWQIMNADVVLPKTRRTTDDGRRVSGQAKPDPTTHNARLDAIERVLRQRIQGWLKTGKIWSGITGWEMATGKVKKQDEIPALYAKPADRDFKRDYTEGRADFGSAPPEGIVYFPEVLRYYLKYRPASRLTAPLKPGEPLFLVLQRVSG